VDEYDEGEEEEEVIQRTFHEGGLDDDSSIGEYYNDEQYDERVS